MTWPTVRLGEILEFKYGRALKKEVRRAGGFSVMGSNGPVGSHDESCTAGSTVVIGRKGSIGEVAYSKEACWPIDTSYFVDANCTTQDLRWLFWRLQGLGLNRMNKSAAVPGLNREDAYSVCLMLPPLPEQRRIAAILDQADELRTKRRRVLELLDDLADATFSEMFGEIISREDRECVVPLADLIQPDRPLTYGILMPGPNVPDGIPYVRVTDMANGRIKEATVRRTTPEISAAYRRSVLRDGDLLVSIRGHVGRTAIVSAGMSGANITQDSARISLNTRADSRYVQAWISTPEATEWLRKHTKGAAVRGINLSDLRRLPVPLPAHADQLSFAKAMTQLEYLRDVCAAETSGLDELIASLQHSAFRGEL